MHRLLFLKITLILLFPGYSIAQCNDTIPSYFTNAPGEYIGCLNDEGRPQGKGIFKFEDGEIYDGKWDSGYIVDGVMTKTTNLLDGSLVIINYKGTFDNVNFGIFDTGILLYKDDSGKLIKKVDGEFKNNELHDGTQISWNGNACITIIKDNGISSDPKRNDENYYNPNDLAPSNIKNDIINLEKEKDKYYINCNIDTIINFRMIFDTGADGVTIGKRLFDRMVQSGVKVHDLGIESKSIGIGGISNGQYFKFDEITIGDITIKNLVAVVSGDQNYSLAGMGLWKKFHNVKWNMKKNELEIIPFEIPSTENGKKKKKKK